MGCGASVASKAGGFLVDNGVFFDGYVRDCAMVLRSTPHSLALQSPYPGSAGVTRYPLVRGSSEVAWETPLRGYTPADYTDLAVAEGGAAWADDNDPGSIASFNCFDEEGGVDRTSHDALEPDTNLPVNPRGRTGLRGRGCLGRFGPNHVTDVIVTAWKRCEDGCVEFDAKGNPVLLFAAVTPRGGSGGDGGDAIGAVSSSSSDADDGFVELALPSGAVEPGEAVPASVKLAFGEGAMAAMGLSKAERRSLASDVEREFRHGGVVVYRGYADDARNTDNAWIETTCVNFHDGSGTTFARFPLACGIDAPGEVSWVEHNSDDVVLSATHALLLSTVYKMRKSWHRYRRR